MMAIVYCLKVISLKLLVDTEESHEMPHTGYPITQSRFQLVAVVI
jgi:hypothetical protein